MKKIMAVALLAGVSALSHADQDAGCGLGSIIWEGQSGLVPKVLAATTNGILGNQTLGISTGTLGCSQDGAVTSRVRLSMFTGSNIEKLARDMSVGQGETLNVLADLMGIPQPDKATFFQATQRHFGTIFAPQNTTAGQVLAALQDMMSRDARLAGYVTPA